MLGSDLMSCIVEIDKIAGANIDRTDAEASFAVIDAGEIDKAAKCGGQWTGIIPAQRARVAARIDIGRRHPWAEKSWRTANQNAERSGLIDQSMGHFVADVHTGKIRRPKRRSGNRLPEFA